MAKGAALESIDAGIEGLKGRLITVRVNAFLQAEMDEFNDGMAIASS